MGEALNRIKRYLWSSGFFYGKRTLNSAFWVVLFCCFTVPKAQLAQMPTGDGTDNNPYLIKSYENLMWVASKSNSSAWSKVYRLEADIDASSSKNMPLDRIGNGSTSFKGKFHGHGHKISKLTINTPGTESTGLFGVAYNDGTAQIDSLGLDSCYINGGNYTGALVGYVYGTLINDCYVTNTTVLSNGSYVGGMVGNLSVSGQVSKMFSCFTSGGSVKSTGDYIGGLVGCVNGHVKDSYSCDSVLGTNYVGGLIGVITGYAGYYTTNCYSTGVVKGTNNSGLLYGRGPAGDVYTTINCFWDTVSSKGSNVQMHDSGSGKSSAEMKLQSTFTNWDFTSTWAMGDNTNDGYPFLRFTAFPVVQTVSVGGAFDTSRHMTKAVANGILLSTSMSAVTAYGFCYGTSPNPTTANNVVNIGAATNAGPFSGVLTALSSSDTTLYYVRAFATNAATTVYGEERVFIRGVMSYHWQPSAGVQPVSSLGRSGNVAFLGKKNAGDFLIQDSTPIWLDKASDSKRYVMDLKSAGDISYGYQYGTALTDLNHTFYITAKNAVPNLSVVRQRTAKAYSLVRFKYSNDTIYASHFDKGDWKATFSGLSQSINKDNNWIPYFVHIRQVSPDSLRVSFGAANQELASIMVGEDTVGGNWGAGSAYCWVTSDTTNARVADVHVFSSSDTTGVNNIWRAFFSPEYLDNGPIFRIPMVIHNIIYDPPGSDSYESCTFDSSTSTKYQFDFTTNADLSLEVGLKGSLEVQGGFFGIVELGNSVDYQETIKGEYHYQYDHSHGTEFTFNKSSATTSMIDNVSAEFMGPARGDVVVYQAFAFRTSMMRRPYMSKFRTASDAKDFVYASAGGVPIPDSCGTVYYKPIQTLIKELHNDTASLIMLQKEYPFDLKTGKVLASALDSTVDPTTNSKKGPRLIKFGDTKEIGGNITDHQEFSRSTISDASRKDTWGYALTYTKAMWAMVGFEFSVSSSSSWSCGFNSSVGKGSTVAYELKDNTSWDVFKITPYTDTRFNTICFLVDSANSYSSFPVEANTNPAVTWEYSVVPPCTAYVGQAATVVVSVKNTSPKNVLSGLPNSFKMSISAVNFPGTFSVYPEDADIAIGQTVPFTFTFTGGNVDSFMQEIRVDCWQPLTNGYSQYNSIKFPMVMRKADVGLVAVLPTDTVYIKKGDALSNAFKVKLVNVGNLDAAVISGETGTSTGATSTYSTITNPVGPGDTTLLTVTLSGDGKQNAYSATFWTQIQGAPETKSLHTLVIVVRDPMDVKKLSSGKIRQLGLRSFGGGRVAVMVPENEHPKLRIFAINGKAVFTASFNPGQSMLDMSTLNLPVGYYVLQLQGKKQDIRQRFIVSKK